MNKLLTSVRKITDRPTFITNMATLFSIFVVLDNFLYAVRDHDVLGWVVFVVVLVAALLTVLAAHDDYREFIAHSVNRRKKADA